jgi:membrane fusion protein YbhG
MKKKVIIAIVVVAIGIAAAFTLRRDHEPKGLIRLSGNIELTEINIAFKTSGKIAELNAVEGDQVTQGQVLARLDRDQLLRQRERDQAGTKSAETQLAQAVTAVEWQQKSVAADIAQRKADLGQAEARLKELETGSRPQEIQEAQAVLASAKSEAARAEADWQRAQTLFKDDDISAQQHDQFRARNETAASAVRQANDRLGLVQEGPRKETIEAAKSQVARARAAVQWAEAQRMEIQRREQEIETRQAEIERARAQVHLVDAQIDDTVAMAPVSGVVLVKSADPGEVVGPGTTVLTIGDLRRPWLRGYINESDLGRVKLGSSVRVTTDSYPGKTYQGKVSFIASEAEFTPKQIQTPDERVKLVYRIKVDIDNPNQELKLNMPADAEIDVGENGK